MILALMLAAMAQTAVPPVVRPAAPPPGGIQRADTDGDGIVTRAEAIAQADALFARMDADRNGTVTTDERRAAMTAMRADRRGPGGPGGGGGGGGGGRGRGGDRELTLAESRTRAAARFDRLDTNRDGRLDATEIAAARPGPMRDRGDDAPSPSAP